MQEPTAPGMVPALPVTQLIEGLIDVDPNVRLRSAVALGELRTSEAAPALVDRLGHERELLIRETLTWATLRIANAALPALHAALRSPRWLARAQACHVLSKLGRRDDAAVLIPVMADPVDSVAARAYWAGAMTRDATVVPALVSQLGRGDSEHRNSLAQALAELGAVGIPALVGALRHHRPEVRTHAADVLSLLGSPAADPAALALREAIADDEPAVRIAALNALGQLGSQFARSQVAGFVDSDEPVLAELARRLGERAGRVRRVDRVDMPAARGAGESLTDGTVAAAPGVLIALACRSAMLAESAAVQALAQDLADAAAGHAGARVAEVLALRSGGACIADRVGALARAAGEPLELTRVVRLPGRTVAHVSSNRRVGAMVSFTGWDGAEQRAALVAAHVVVADPRYLSRADVPPEVLAAVGSGAATRHAAGLAEAFVHDTVLLEQVCAVDPTRTVDGLLYGTGVRITGFGRVSVGEW